MQENCVAFLTSGGDAPGMNAAIRAITRMCLNLKKKPFAIFDGYKGLIENEIEEFDWKSVANILPLGGTVIRSSRSQEFMTAEGRRKAVKNLVKKGINQLIVIGGDGSLTGAITLHKEWSAHLSHLMNSSQITNNEADSCKELKVVGLAGSIDNDICGTSLSIGADTALHRIIEAVNSISSTAISHARAFVVEVMGRCCGWLALNAFVASGADWVFIPELEISPEWAQNLCQRIRQNRHNGKLDSIIIIAEGCINSGFNSNIICKILKEELNLDCRITVLGHIQRGGTPSALDRFSSTLQGCKAVQMLNEEHLNPTLLGYRAGHVILNDLEKCINETIEIKSLFHKGDLKCVLNLRGEGFQESIQIAMMRMNPEIGKTCTSINTAFMTVGAPAGGMNACIYTLASILLHQGKCPLLIYNGFEGFETEDIRPCSWNDIWGIIQQGGSFIGSNRYVPKSGEVAFNAIQKHQIKNLVVVGGFEALMGVKLIKEFLQDKTYCLRLIYIPATISNNIPYTHYSIGVDTALNIIALSCDAIKQSASSSRKRVFVVEVQGGSCGFLATIGGLVSGASQAYIPESRLDLIQIATDAKKLKKGFQTSSRQGRIIMRNEKCSSVYSTKSIAEILQDESAGTYDARWVVLGHIQQGGSPSPADRISAVNFAYKCLMHFESNTTVEASEFYGVSYRDSDFSLTNIDNFFDDADFSNRSRKSNEFWLGLHTGWV